jgi:hypothetical protein
MILKQSQPTLGDTGYVMHVLKVASISQYFSLSGMPADERRALKTDITDASYG